jgi:hypothetical protein
MQMEDKSEHTAESTCSHADTCVAVRNALVVQHLLDKKVNVTRSDALQRQVTDLDLVSAALACDCLTTGEAIMLMSHQAVHIPTTENDLLCPIMQMRMNNMSAPSSWKHNHSNLSHAPSVTQDGDELCIPFGLQHGATCTLLPCTQANTRRACQLQTI